MMPFLALSSSWKKRCYCYLCSNIFICWIPLLLHSSAIATARTAASYCRAGGNRCGFISFRPPKPHLLACHYHQQHRVQPQTPCAFLVGYSVAKTFPHYTSFTGNSDNNIQNKNPWRIPSLSSRSTRLYVSTSSSSQQGDSTEKRKENEQEDEPNSSLWEEDEGDDNSDFDDNDYAEDEEDEDEVEDEVESSKEEEEDEEDSVATNNSIKSQQQQQQWLEAIEKAQTALTKKQTSLQQEWKKAQTVEGTMARAQLIVNNLYLFNTKQRVHTVVDWENDGQEILLELDPQYDSASAEADALFAQARKLKRGSQVVQTLLEQVEQGLQVLRDCQQDLLSILQNDNDDASNNNSGRFQLVQDRLRRTASTTKFQEPNNDKTQTNKKQQSSSNNKRNNNNHNHNNKPALGTPASNVRRLTTPNGATVLVGRNRRGNEYLTFTQARGNDIWMHARGTPGAHVLLLDRRGSVPPTPDCLEFAAHLAAFYSDGRTEAKVPVTVAEPKHLLKPKNAPLGAVKLRQEVQVLYGCPDLVPVELQEARAQSGLYATDEYRSADKAKHRKRTQQHVQQEKEKRKQQQQERKKRKRQSHHDAKNDG